jgi:hypothetical protein
MQLCVRNELTTAVSTVMINWMMVFQRLKFLIIMTKLGETIGRYRSKFKQKLEVKGRAVALKI